MKFLTRCALTGICVFRDPEILSTQQVSSIILPNLCNDDMDCKLPQTCCTGFIYNQCCDEGGKGLKTTPRSFPNISIPEIPELLPPQPLPVPV